MIERADMNRFGSLPNHENRSIYEGSPPQGLSKARRGKEDFIFLFFYPPRGSPDRGRGRSSNQMDRRVIILASNQNTTIFIGKIVSGEMQEKNLDAHQEFFALQV
jgi:hypothetical protein